METLTKGTILENTYEIIEEIGSGGGGIVFRARHLRLQTDVVVKKIKDDVIGKVKLSQEADILKRLKHSYLPRIYDFIETEDGVYTVMDYIHGKNMNEAVRQHGKYSQKQVRKWAGQLGEALAYLHSRKPPIIHSDIKPANIMLTEEENICLIDFNISLAMGEEAESAVGISVGFSPPEQYRDPALYARLTHNYTVREPLQEADKPELNDKTEILSASEKSKLSGCTHLMGKGIDVRSDVYSLGATLYFLLTGTEPSADFDKRISVSEMDIPVSEGFAIILDKMMELLPENRYKNGGEFLEAIKNCHKLDRRYIAMHRKEAGLQIASFAFLVMGILTAFSGFYRMHIDKSKAYEEEVYSLYLNGSYEECIELGGKYSNAAPLFLKSKEDKEISGDICYIVGNAYFELEDYPNAGNVFKHALEWNEGNGLYYRDYAVTLAKLGQTEEAEKALEQGIDLGLAQDSIYMAQGEIACVREKYTDAVKYLTQTISVSTDMQLKKRAVLLCADTYKTMGNDAVDKEIALLEQYIGQFEGNGTFIFTERLADAYLRKAAAVKEEKYYQKALTLFLTVYDGGYVTFQLQQNIAILYEHLDCFDEAEEILLEMAESYPRRYEVYKRLAYLEADRQQMKEISDRDYRRMQEYYEKAQEQYSGEEQDMEMEMLRNMMQELKESGWL